MQNRRAVIVETVVPPPLQETDLHGDLRQFVSIGVQFNRAELLHADLRRKGPSHLRGGGDDFLFQTKQKLQRDIKEIPAAARRIKHRDARNFPLKFRKPGFFGRRAFALQNVLCQVAPERRPFAPERSHEHRFNQRFNIRLAGVMRAKLRPLAGVKAALEQVAHDAWLDVLPVCGGGGGQRPDFVRCEFKYRGIVEKMPVEMADFVKAKPSAFRHAAEKVFQRFRKSLRIIEADFADFRKDIRRKQAGILREKTEHKAVEKPGDAKIFLLRNVMLLARFRVAQFNRFALLQRKGNRRDLPGERFRDFRRGALRAERARIGEHRAEHAQGFRGVNLCVAEFVGFLHRAVEIRADNELFKVANDKQGRVEKRFAVTEKLLVSLFQVFARPLVFPSETILFPDIGKAALIARRFGHAPGIVKREKLRVFHHALLKAKRVIAGRIGLNRRRDAKHPAKVAEMILIRRRFLTAKPCPFCFEFCRGHE